MRFLAASEWGRFGQWGVVLFRCGAVWTRVEAAASHAARVRDAPAASWRCRPTPCSALDLDPWTTAPGFAFRPATARPHTASTTRSSRKVKVCVFCLPRPSDDTSPYLGVIHMLFFSQECREGTAMPLILESGRRYSLHFTVLLLTYWPPPSFFSFCTLSAEHNFSYWDFVSPVLYLLLWLQPFHFEIYFFAYPEQTAFLKSIQALVVGFSLMFRLFCITAELYNEFRAELLNPSFLVHRFRVLQNC